MKGTNVLLTLALAFLVELTGSARIAKKSFSLPLEYIHTDSTKCGEVITTSTGFISYKLNQPLVPNERCVWIIRPEEDNWTFQIGILDMGFGNTTEESGLSILPFSNKVRTINPFVLNEIGTYEFRHASILVVTFHTGPTIITQGKTGFHLQFSATNDEAVEIPSENSIDVRLPEGTGVIQRRQMVPYELSTYLLVPPSGIIDPTVQNTIFMTMDYTCDAPSTSAYYYFSITKNYQYMERVCDDATFYFQHNDIILFVINVAENITTERVQLSFTSSKCTEGMVNLY